ncbi:hypothetical protein Hanom_Chr15g01373671 [Helianthus anomalus]
MISSTFNAGCHLLFQFPLGIPTVAIMGKLNCHWSFLMGPQHPNSKKWLGSLCKVRKFILDSSHTGKSIG